MRVFEGEPLVFEDGTLLEMLDAKLAEKEGETEGETEDDCLVDDYWICCQMDFPY